MLVFDSAIHKASMYERSFDIFDAVHTGFLFFSPRHDPDIFNRMEVAEESLLLK
jgi:hypothetical protein